MSRRGALQRWIRSSRCGAIDEQWCLHKSIGHSSPPRSGRLSLAVRLWCLKNKFNNKCGASCLLAPLRPQGGASKQPKSTDKEVENVVSINAHRGSNIFV